MMHDAYLFAYVSLILTHIRRKYVLFFFRCYSSIGQSVYSNRMEMNTKKYGTKKKMLKMVSTNRMWPFGVIVYKLSVHITTYNMHLG